MSEPVKVEILDREFMVAAPPEEREGLMASARQLDARMREVRDTGKVVGIDRIAIMAALNITHEMLQAQASASTASDTGERIGRLSERLEAYLAEVNGGDGSTDRG
jgi:cell division protein ZapA